MRQGWLRSYTSGGGGECAELCPLRSPRCHTSRNAPTRATLEPRVEVLGAPSHTSHPHPLLSRPVTEGVVGAPGCQVVDVVLPGAASFGPTSTYSGNVVEVRNRRVPIGN